MSGMEAKHVKLVKLTDEQVADLYETTRGMGDYDKSDYLYDNRIIHVNGTYWKYIFKNELDATGFVHVISKSETEAEAIALWYNGGGCLDEVIESTLK